MNFKNIIIIAFVIPFSSTVSAQDQFSLGLNLGGTYSNVRGNETARENNYALDALFGASLQYNFSEKTALKIDVNFERKSFEKTANGSYFLDGPDPVIILKDIEIRSTLKYISIPVLLRHKLGEKRNFFINYGPFVSFLSGIQAKLDGDKVNDTSRDYFRDTDLGLTLGIGTTLNINSSNRIHFELRNNLGIMNINRLRMNNTKEEVRTNALNLIANWEFDL